MIRAIRAHHRKRTGRPGFVSAALAMFLQLVLLTGPLWESSRPAAPVDLRLAAHLDRGGSAAQATPEAPVRHDETTCLACVTSSLVAQLQAGTPVLRVSESAEAATEPTVLVSLPFAPPSSLHSRAPPGTA